MRWQYGIYSAGILALLLMTVTTRTATAHEQREVLDGQYQLAVGFLNEPAIEGEQNGLDLRVSRLTSSDATPAPASDGDEGTPVEGLADSLQAEVTAAGETMPLDIEPRFGQPGAYRAVFFPTEPGDYTFRIFGEIDGQDIDESFTSSPDTFSSVQEVAALQFPAQVPAGTALGDELDDVESTVATAQTLAIAGVVLGLIGAGLGALALMRRRPAPAVATRREEP